VKVGDLVRIIEINEPVFSERNIGKLAVISFIIDDSEVEVQIVQENGSFEPWIYKHEHLEKLNESYSK